MIKIIIPFGWLLAGYAIVLNKPNTPEPTARFGNFFIETHSWYASDSSACFMLDSLNDSTYKLVMKRPLDSTLKLTKSKYHELIGYLDEWSDSISTANRRADDLMRKPQPESTDGLSSLTDTLNL